MPRSRRTRPNESVVVMTAAESRRTRLRAFPPKKAALLKACCLTSPRRAGRPVTGADIDIVVMANEAIAFNAVRYLFSIGHREIGHLRSAVAISNFNERRAGFEEAMSALQLKETRTIALTPTLEGAYSDMREYLNGRADSVRATAFFADNDAIAIGAIRALQEHGFHVPDDVSVIGVDDIPFSAINTPPLTTMRVSRSQLGHLTVDILTRRIKNPRC